LYVGLSYVHENKFAEATALFDRALQRSQEARKLHASSKVDDNVSDYVTLPRVDAEPNCHIKAFVVRLDKLDRKIRGWKPFVHATSFLETMKKVEPEMTSEETPAEETTTEEGHLAEAVSTNKYIIKTDLTNFLNRLKMTSPSLNSLPNWKLLLASLCCSIWRCNRFHSPIWKRRRRLLDLVCLDSSAETRRPEMCEIHVRCKRKLINKCR
jgi:hypothetical protein